MSIFAEDYTKALTIEGVNIVIKKLSLKDQLEAAKKFNAGDDSSGSLDLLTKSIVSWGVKDKDGKDVPISTDNLGRLRADVVNDLIKEISAFNSIGEQEIKN